MIKERFMNNKIKYKHEVQYNQILNDLQNLLFSCSQKGNMCLNQNFGLRQFYILTKTVKEV